MATKLFNSFQLFFCLLRKKKIKKKKKTIYFLHCIFSLISIFSVLVEFKQQEIIYYCLIDFTLYIFQLYVELTKVCDEVL